MNNNLNFSKNVFGGEGNTKIAGYRPMSMNNNDGGRMTVDEVRERQFNATYGIDPDKPAFQVEKKDGYVVPNNGSFNGQPSQNSANSQMDMTRRRIDAFKNMNNKGSGF